MAMAHGRLSLQLPPAIPSRPRRRRSFAVFSSAGGGVTVPPASSVEVEMFPGRDGVYAARVRPPTSVLLWDLDNKPPRGPPFPAASHLLAAAALLGRVVDASAFANRHAFTHLPSWVTTERRERRKLDRLERLGLSAASSPYVCSMCGRKFSARVELKTHFKRLHESERQKKLSRMRQLKGKKKEKFREKHIAGNLKYEEGARELIRPKVGYGLASELRRAGLKVRTVEDKPQAADAALKRQVQHSVARGVDWIVIVSDDSDFVDTLRKAKEADLRTAVVGDASRALAQVADVWLPWFSVENGEVDEEMIRAATLRGRGFASQGFEGDNDLGMGFLNNYDGRILQNVMDGIVSGSPLLYSGGVSMFSEEDFIDEDGYGMDSEGDDFAWIAEEEDGYFS